MTAAPCSVGAQPRSSPSTTSRTSNPRKILSYTLAPNIRFSFASMANCWILVGRNEAMRESLDDHKYGRRLKRFTVGVCGNRALSEARRGDRRGPQDFRRPTVDLVPHFVGEALEGYDDNFGAARCATARNALRARA